MKGIRFLKSGPTFVRSRKRSRRTKTKRRRSTHKRIIHKRKRTSTNRPRRRSYGRCLIDENGLTFINSFEWDVTRYPEDATLAGNKVTYEQLHQELCHGTVKLLIPAIHKNPTDPLTVLYEVLIKKRIVKVIDILNAIWKFYNFSKVTEDDLENIRIVESKKIMAEQYIMSMYNHPESLRFKLFLEGNTKFNGLVNQDTNVYVVRITASTGSQI